MHRVHDSIAEPLSVPHLAIAIKDTGNGTHAGIFYRVEQASQYRLLHLAWHHDLRIDGPNPTYHWVEVPLPQLRLQQVAAICEHVAKTNAPGSIPYAFGSPVDCFDRNTYQYLIGRDNSGLTCATFVLAVFHLAGIPLVRYNTWPPGSVEDQQFQTQVAEILEEQFVNGAPNVTASDIATIRSEVGVSRFSAEHVAAAGMLQKWRRPISYSSASRWGRKIVSKLRGQAYDARTTVWEMLLLTLGR